MEDFAKFLIFRQGFQELSHLLFGFQRSISVRISKLILFQAFPQGYQVLLVLLNQVPHGLIHSRPQFILWAFLGFLFERFGLWGFQFPLKELFCQGFSEPQHLIMQHRPSAAARLAPLGGFRMIKVLHKLLHPGLYLFGVLLVLAHQSPLAVQVMLENLPQMPVLLNQGFHKFIHHPLDFLALISVHVFPLDILQAAGKFQKLLADLLGRPVASFVHLPQQLPHTFLQLVPAVGFLRLYPGGILLENLIEEQAFQVGAGCLRAFHNPLLWVGTVKIQVQMRMMVFVVISGVDHQIF